MTIMRSLWDVVKIVMFYCRHLDSSAFYGPNRMCVISLWSVDVDWQNLLLIFTVMLQLQT